MTAGPWTVFGQFLEDLGLGVHNIDADGFSVALVKNTWTPDTSADEVWADISANEVDDTGNGYTQFVLSGTWTRSGTTITFDGDDPAFLADGGDIVDARYAVIFNTSKSNKLVCYCLLDTTPADVDIVNGKQLDITIDALGIGTVGPA